MESDKSERKKEIEILELHKKDHDPWRSMSQGRDGRKLGHAKSSCLRYVIKKSTCSLLLAFRLANFLRTRKMHGLLIAMVGSTTNSDTFINNETHEITEQKNLHFHPYFISSFK